MKYRIMCRFLGEILCTTELSPSLVHEKTTLFTISCCDLLVLYPQYNCMPCCHVQVSCIGQMLCAVLADTKAHAKRGAAAVKISYEDLPDPVFTVEVRGVELDALCLWMC